MLKRGNLHLFLFILLTAVLHCHPLFAQDGGRIEPIETEGIDSADGNNRGNNGNNSRVLQYLPVGVQQFANAYPKTHFRFVSGDILSSIFLELTGLFAFAAGSDPISNSLERSTSESRHTGLAAFIATATVGHHGINKIEQMATKRITATHTKEKIKTLKNLAGLNILAGVYAYIAASEAVNGKSKSEILETLGAKETFVMATSMHIAFLGADKFMDKMKKTTADLKFLNEVSKNPQAIKVMRKTGIKSALDLYPKILDGAETIDKIRDKVAKGKVAMATAQPYSIPAITTITAAEWTVYYTFAKVWDSLISKNLINALQRYDKYCLARDNQDLFNGVYETDLLSPAKQIIDNFNTLTQLMYAPLIDEQMLLLERATKIDYLFKLYEEILGPNTNEDKKELLTNLMNPSHEMFDLNKEFFKWLIKSHNPRSSNNEELDVMKMMAAFQNISVLNLNISNQDIPPHSQRSLQSMVSTHQKIIDEGMDTLLKGIDLHKKTDPETYEEKSLTYLNQEIDKLNADQSLWSNKINKVSGMSMNSIESSYKKYKIDPNKDLAQQDIGITGSNIPHPQTVYEVLLLQNLYLNQVKALALNETVYAKIEDMQQKSELVHMFQASALEKIQNFK